MKKIFNIILFLSLTIILFGCGSEKGVKTKESKLYFDWTGIAETTHIAYTKDLTFDLKTVFKVGNKTSSYNDKKIGVTTYDDIFYYIYEWGSSEEYLSENEDCKISSDGIVTRKRLSTVVIYAALKEEPANISEDEKANGGMHILTLFFGNDKTFGEWVGDNQYLESWLEPGEKLATMTFKFNEDFTYSLTITEGIWSTGSTTKTLENKVITGKLFGSSSAGAVRHDDVEGYTSYDFRIEENDYGLSYDSTYTLFTGYSFENNNSWNTIRFLPKGN